MLAISLDDCRDAQARIAQLVHKTPVLSCSTISDGIAGGQMELFFKAEVFQKSGSFKIRGAANAVFSLPAESCARGVVTHSSGNHAAAVALAAKLRGVPAHIVVPHNTPKVKMDAVRAYGGTLYLCEPTIDAREAECARVQAATGAAFVHPYNDPKVMAGQGTIALEFLEQVPHLDAIVVPISGGGMTSGIAVAAKALKPGIKIIAAEPTGVNDAADVAACKAAGDLIPCSRPSTIADGLQGRLGSNTWPIVRDLVDGVVTVSEEEIVRAMRALYMYAKVVVEPSGAVGLAAVTKAAAVAAEAEAQGDGPGLPGSASGVQRAHTQGDEQAASVLKGCRAVGIILCGGNVDLDAKGFFEMSNWAPAPA